MSPADFSWSDYFRDNLQLYRESLLREVAGNLIRPRSQWPVEELIERMVDSISNAPIVDRRLRELPAGCRRLMACIALSGQPRWRAGNLLELLTTLGEVDPLQCLLALLRDGMLFPDLIAASAAPRLSDEPPVAQQENKRVPYRCSSFDDWFAHTPPNHLLVCGVPEITQRVISEDLGLPDLSQSENDSPLEPLTGSEKLATREADGLELPLRLAILWQQAARMPFRLTQQGDFYKRDLERLQTDGLLGSQPADNLLELPDIGQLIAALALAENILAEDDGQLVGGDLPPAWEQGLPETLRALWQALMRIEKWNVVQGSVTGEILGNPYPGVYLLCLLLIARLPKGSWCPVDRITAWVIKHHPYWQKSAPGGEDNSARDGLERFLLGVAYQLRFVEAALPPDGSWLIRLSRTGNWLFDRDTPPPQPNFPQTLVVQPNLEILLYRQGATPALIAGIGRFAAWKGLGAACNLQLDPETVYDALQRGESFESILQQLQRHGMKETPAPVIDSLRTWAEKRERITVYPAAVVLEFLAAGELDDALARGVPITRIEDRLGIIRKEGDLDYQHFRLRGSRDYTLPPEPCVTARDDGVTLEVDLNKSDLLLESEIRRFSDELESANNSGIRCFQLTPASLQRARECGMTADTLDHWFMIRCSHSMPPAARMLMTGRQAPPLELRRLTIIQVADEELTDGLLQWQETQPFIVERLGPTVFVVDDETVPILQEKLRLLEMTIEENRNAVT